MKIADLARKAEKFATDNSPAILTAFGVTGAITATYLTGKATVKATRIIDEEVVHAKNIRRELPDKKEKFLLVWKLYIPAAGVLTLTCVSIVCANKIGTRRTAAMASAFALSERAFDEYKSKVIDHIGAPKEMKVREDVAKDRVDRVMQNGVEIIVTGQGDVLCHDNASGRVFYSSMEALRRAENDINKQIHNDDYATLTNFYNHIGLEPTSLSDDLGWNTDKFLELHFSPILTKDGKPCISFDFGTVPIREPWRFC